MGGKSFKRWSKPNKKRSAIAKCLRVGDEPVVRYLLRRPTQHPFSPDALNARILIHPAATPNPSPSSPVSFNDATTAVNDQEDFKPQPEGLAKAREVMVNARRQLDQDVTCYRYLLEQLEHHQTLLPQLEHQKTLALPQLEHQKALPQLPRATFRVCRENASDLHWILQETLRLEGLRSEQAKLASLEIARGFQRQLPPAHSGPLLDCTTTTRASPWQCAPTPPPLIL